MILEVLAMARAALEPLGAVSGPADRDAAIGLRMVIDPPSLADAAARVDGATEAVAEVPVRVLPATSDPAAWPACAELAWQAAAALLAAGFTAATLEPESTDALEPGERLGGYTVTAAVALTETDDD